MTARYTDQITMEEEERERGGQCTEGKVGDDYREANQCRKEESG